MKLKRLLVSVMLVFVMCVSLLGTVASAAAYTPSTASAEEEVVPRAEETMWYFRNNNGKVEKRLWSITEGKWLTDWIPA